MELRELLPRGEAALMPIDRDSWNFDEAGAPLVRFARVEQFLRAQNLASVSGHEVWAAIRRIDAGESPGDTRRLWSPEGYASRIVRWQGGVDYVYFVRPKGSPVQLHYLGAGERSAHLLDELDPMLHCQVGASLPLVAVAVLSDRLLVVYSTPSDAYGSGSSLRQVWGTLREGQVSFSAPETIQTGIRQVRDLQLVAGKERVDMLWQMGATLSYSAHGLHTDGWAPAVVLTETCTGVARTASLSARGAQVHATWSDDRYMKWEGLRAVNSRRPVVTASLDGGLSFLEPCILGTVDGEAQVGAQSYLLYSEERVLLIQDWEGVPGPLQMWLLEPDLRQISMAGEISFRGLRDVFEAWSRNKFETP